MSNIDYENDNVEVENESSTNVVYDVHDKNQTYRNKKCSKGVEKHCFTKYKTCGGASVRSKSKPRSLCRRTVVSSKCSKRSPPACKKDETSSKSSASYCCKLHKETGVKLDQCDGDSSKKSLSKIERSAKCYDVQPSKKTDICGKPEIWQNGVYKKDICGSGIVPTRFDFRSSRKFWCQTPLTMYQATIGELARKILCREKIVPRDVREGPPCNIEKYILPFCRGYYRKYECLRPCEEEYAYYKDGKKRYRDCVQRYWEPCLTKEQKIKLDINEFAPHNAYLSTKIRRRNQDANMNVPCW